jgi:hypothetical protein
MIILFFSIHIFIHLPYNMPILYECGVAHNTRKMFQKHSSPYVAFLWRHPAISFIQSTFIEHFQSLTHLEACVTIQTGQKQWPHSIRWGRIDWHPNHMMKDCSLGDGRRVFSQVLHSSMENVPQKDMSSQTLSHTRTIRMLLIDPGPWNDCTAC